MVNFAGQPVLIDTNILIYQLNGELDLAGELLKAKGLFISAISEAEIIAGTGRKELQEVQDFLSAFTILPVTARVAELAGAYKSVFPNKGLKDLLIGATAQLHKLTLVTANKKDFADLERIESIFVRVL